MSAAKKLSKTATDLAAYEAGIVASAVSWVAFVQVRPGDRRRKEAEDQAGAIVAARELLADTGRKILIYAVNAAGRDVMAGTVGLDGAFTSALIGA